MKVRTLKKNKVNVITLGCSKNLVDSEVLMGQLRANNYDVEHESEQQDSNIIIVNTCGFIDNAKQESIDTILQYAELKEQGLIEKLYVTGCLSERYKPELQKEITAVDAYFGTRDLPALLKTLKADYKHELVGERLLTTPRHFAYLKISEGCDRPCSFCAIPIMRGGHISKPIEELVQEAKNLAKAGTKELLIIAQDSTYYGLDIYKKRRLAELLQALSEVEGIEWIRLHYAFPSGFPMDVLDVMANNPKICKYLDIPLQHGSTKVLQSMKRGITAEKTQELLQTIREKVPGITLRTTLISGYPGETLEDHQTMIDFIVKSKFDRLGVFNYSHEENTSAYDLVDDVPTDEKQRRAAEIMQIQEGISMEKNQAKVGQVVRVLFDRIEGDYFIGRSEADSPEVDNEILVSAKDTYLSPGSFAQVRIDSAEAFDLYGTLV